MILRWGYNKTTIDDISRQAGVGKGTIYLHWKTREDLFIALIAREKIQLGEDVQRNLAADPAGGTLHGFVKYAALGLIKRPILKALMLRDVNVLGKLAQTALGDAAYAAQLEGFRAYLGILRAQKVLREDLSLEAQVYVLAAAYMGVLLVEPFMPAQYALSDEQKAELIAEMVRRTLETGQTVSEKMQQDLSAQLNQYMDQAGAVAKGKLQHDLDASDSEE